MPPLNPPDKPKYARGHAIIPRAEGDPLEFHVWHKLVALQPSKRPATALGACGQRFEPEAFLYADRTLIDWGEEDDLCECAAEMPTEDQCKNQLSVLQFGAPSSA
jgi:hypothetical protein